MKDHEIREFVDHLTRTAQYYKDCDCLREAISRVVKEHLVNASIEEAKEYQKDSQGRCIHCQGWGCRQCCSSDEEIRQRQGIFS